MHKVTKLRPLSNYRLWLRFEDTTEGTVDLSDLAGRGVFGIWKAHSKSFDRVHIGTSGEVVWDDNLDLCPNSLYMKITNQSVEDVFPNSKENS